MVFNFIHQCSELNWWVTYAGVEDVLEGYHYETSIEYGPPSEADAAKCQVRNKFGCMSRSTHFPCLPFWVLDDNVQGTDSFHPIWKVSSRPLRRMWICVCVDQSHKILEKDPSCSERLPVAFED
jgi:hypothetical protein